MPSFQRHSIQSSNPSNSSAFPVPLAVFYGSSLLEVVVAIIFVVNVPEYVKFFMAALCLLNFIFLTFCLFSILYDFWSLLQIYKDDFIDIPTPISAILRLFIPVYNFYWVFPFFIKMSYCFDVYAGVKEKRSGCCRDLKFLKGIILSVIGILLTVTIVIFPQSDIPVVLFVLFVLYFFLYRFLIYGFYWFGYVVPVLAVMVAFFPENLLWVFVFSLYVFVTKMALICYKSRLPCLC